MQMPTIQNVRIRSTRDAHQIFLGVARNILPLITRRLDAEERRAIIPGNVYVWEERGANCEATGLGMERWWVAAFPCFGGVQLLIFTKRAGLMVWAGDQAEYAT
jgi:hypothetical protein